MNKPAEMRLQTQAARLAVVVVFILILITGLCVYDDYCVSVDEPQERRSSVISYRQANKLLLNRDVFTDFDEYPPIEAYEDRYYGVAMQLPLVLAEDIYHQVIGVEMPLDAVFQMRHMYTFLVYYVALISFYFLVKHLFGSRWLALGGVLMVFLFPRFFAHSFYNIKDMVFASLMMIALCLAERVLTTGRNSRWCLLFALCGALLVSSRLAGALVIVLLLGMMLLQDLSHLRHSKARQLTVRRALGYARPYLLICMAYPLWIMVTPASWNDPLGFSLGYLSVFSNYSPWHGYVAYCGSLYAGYEVPRGYFIIWILLTVPLVYLLLCAAGIGRFCMDCIKRHAATSQTCMLGIMLVMIVSTIGYQIIKHPTLYNGWRHAFYLYPMLIVFSVRELSSIVKSGGLLRRFSICLLTASLAFNACRIVAAHPYQYAQFNMLGRYYAIGFERDYWHMSEQELLTWLREYDPGVQADEYMRFIYAEGDPQAEIARRLERSNEPIRYILLNYSRIPNTNDLEVAGFHEIHAIWLDEVKLSAVLERD